MPPIILQVDAPLIDAISKFAWPTLTLFALLFFRREVRALLARMKKGPIGMEFADTTQVTELAEKPLPAPPALTAPPAPPAPEQQPPISATIDSTAPAQVVDARTITARSTLAATIENATRVDSDDEMPPEARVLFLYREIELAIRRVLAATGHYPPHGHPSLSFLMPLLRKTVLTSDVRDSFQAFQSLRNELAHSRKRLPPSDVEGVLKAGRELLAYFRGVVRPYRVAAFPVPLFRDPHGTDAHTFSGVLLESSGTAHVFPTTRSYQVGDEVAWEWNTTNVYPPAWYREPKTGTIQEAWQGAPEFVGRPIDEL